MAVTIMFSHRFYEYFYTSMYICFAPVPIPEPLTLIGLENLLLKICMKFQELTVILSIFIHTDALPRGDEN